MFKNYSDLQTSKTESVCTGKVFRLVFLLVVGFEAHTASF